MKLEKWALIAEVVGSAAIVVSIVILIIELRTNTELTRITAYESVSRDFDNNRQFYLSNPEVFDLAFAIDNGALAEIDVQSKDGLRAAFYLLNIFTGLERAYLAYQAGVFGEDEWGRIHRSECSTWGQIQGTEYEPRVSFRLTDGYASHLRSTCTPEVVTELQNLYEGETRDRP